MLWVIYTGLGMMVIDLPNAYPSAERRLPKSWLSLEETLPTVDAPAKDVIVLWTPIVDLELLL